MSDDRPEPLVPQEVDLRGMSGFMLDVDRLLASELVALGTPEECWAALMLWCRAWQQRPAGSLPNDERILAAFSGAGKRWSKVRGMAMRGFIECSDGRLYHPVLAAEVTRAWKKRQTYRADQERLRRWRSERKLSDSEWDELRAAVFKRDEWKCTTCGSPDDLHCDHIIPTSRGGASEPANLTTLCRKCHGVKTAKSDKRPIRNGARNGSGDGVEMHFEVASRTVETGTGTGTVRVNSLPGSLGAARAKPLPEAFQVPPDWLAEAEQKRGNSGLPAANLSLEAEQFIAHQRRNAATSFDWRHSWISWALRAKPASETTPTPRRKQVGPL